MKTLKDFYGEITVKTLKDNYDDSFEISFYSDKIDDNIINTLEKYKDYEVYDVRIVLQIFIEVDFYVMAVAAQVVACQVDQHHMLRVLLGVVQQKLDRFHILLVTAGTFCRSGYRIDADTLTGDTAVRLG